MMYRNILFFTIGLLFIGKAVIAEDEEEELPRRCYQFTWLGPTYTNNSIFMNATCEDATELSDGVPCQLPLVVSYDGSPPDIDYIWRNHLLNASCILAENDVCAQYTYYFDGVVENSTYMCTRAINSAGQAITSGCYTDTSGSFSTRVCLCRSEQGAIPCNNALWSTHISIISFLPFLIVCFINREFANWFFN